MTLHSGPFNGLDRAWRAEDFARYHAFFIGNGVFPNPSTGLQVMQGENMQTIIRPGYCWINGYYLWNTDDYVIQHDNADGVLKRIDRIVVRWDISLRDIIIDVKKGTFASNPVAPTVQRDAAVYELVLADVLINNGVVQITQANITDTRLNSELCGIVHGLVNQVDTTTIFNQYQAWFNEYSVEQQAEFEAWMATLNDILDGDVAGNLANRIFALEQSNSNLIDDINNHKNDILKHSFYAIASGTNSYTATVDSIVNRYVEGFKISIKIQNAATSNCTLNINGLGVKNIVKADGSIAKDLKANSIYSLVFSGAAFILQGEGGDILNGVIKEFISSSSQTLNAGDFLAIVQGEPTNLSSFGLQATCKALPVNNNTYLVLIGGSGLWGILVRITNTSITVGTLSQIASFYPNSFDSIMTDYGVLIFSCNTNYVVRSYLLKINDLNFSLHGSEQIPQISIYNIKLAKVTGNKLLCIANSQYQSLIGYTALFFTINYTDTTWSLTMSTPVLLETAYGIANDYAIDLKALSTTEFLVGLKTISNSSAPGSVTALKLRFLKINSTSATTFSINAATTIETSLTYNIKLAYLDNGIFNLTYINNEKYRVSINLTVNRTSGTVTLGTKYIDSSNYYDLPDFGTIDTVVINNFLYMVRTYAKMNDEELKKVYFSIYNVNTANRTMTELLSFEIAKVTYSSTSIIQRLTISEGVGSTRLVTYTDGSITKSFVIDLGAAKYTKDNQYFLGVCKNSPNLLEKIDFTKPF